MFNSISFPTSLHPHKTCHGVFYLGSSWKMLVQLNKLNQRVEITEYATWSRALGSCRPNSFPYCSWLEAIGISSCLYVPSAIKHFMTFISSLQSLLCFIYLSVRHRRVGNSFSFRLPQSLSQPRLPMPMTGLQSTHDSITPHFPICFSVLSVPPSSISDFLS
jgi:hypothetical protein